MGASFLVRGSEVDQACQFVQGVTRAARQYRAGCLLVSRRLMDAYQAGSRFILCSRQELDFAALCATIWDPKLQTTMRDLQWKPDVAPSYRFLWLMEQRYQLVWRHLNEDAGKVFRKGTADLLPGLRDFSRAFLLDDFSGVLLTIRDATGFVPGHEVVAGAGFQLTGQLEKVHKAIPGLEKIGSELARRRGQLLQRRLWMVRIGGVGAAASLAVGAFLFIQ